MEKRPVSVTIVAWILIVISAIALVQLVFGYFYLLRHTQITEPTSPISPMMSAVIGFVVALINLMCGVFILRGENWARIVYAVIGVLGFIFSFAMGAAPLGILLASIIIYVIFIFILFRSAASAYFKATS